MGNPKVKVDFLSKRKARQKESQPQQPTQSEAVSDLARAVGEVATSEESDLQDLSEDGSHRSKRPAFTPAGEEAMAEEGLEPVDSPVEPAAAVTATPRARRRRPCARC